jgi:colanic acid/amylovoran biosynthesis glycosyltransferase
MPEFVKDGVTGYLVPPRNIEAIADRIVSLLRNPEQAKAMGKAGRISAEGHSIDISVKGHEQLYQSILGKK